MKAFFSMLLFVLISVALVGWLVRGQEVGEPLIPGPENVVQNFVKALASHHYEAARAQLSDELGMQTPVQELKQLDQALTGQYGTYDLHPHGQEQKQADQATYQALIQTARGEVLHPTFTLQRAQDSGLWEIMSFEELVAAAQ
ncbi:MAG: hypothetical protein M3220_07460 [Chloroflexota bacterium]|nr:hypothetical protein [Chloroflexota bacterium]